eukprot:TRINITY_DN3378_c2_g1_i1.p1 TRINITY_DN3378_c2_g1~~TRINITY_DN3378_c2_g1_i1.p1  ORF type:complete len:209 (+),score=43.97 TRINITY_DN3378_c2_g1_i1:63-689(+)
MPTDLEDGLLAELEAEAEAKRKNQTTKKKTIRKQKTEVTVVRRTDNAGLHQGTGMTKWHRVRSAVLLLGIWLYFLLAVCITWAKNIDELEDRLPGKYIKAMRLMSAGSGIVSSSAFFLGLLAMWGIKKHKHITIASTFFLACYLLGGLLNIIGTGMMTDYLWDLDSYNGLGTTKDSVRTTMVGKLMGEACFIVSGLLVLLPEFYIKFF